MITKIMITIMMGTMKIMIKRIMYYNDGKNDDNASKVLGVPEALLLIAPACYYSQTQLLTPTKHKSLNYKSMQENTSRTEHEPYIIKPADLEYPQYKGFLKFFFGDCKMSPLEYRVVV